MNNTIKKDAQIAWQKGNKSEAYNIAWQLPLDEFYPWVTKTKKGISLSKEFYNDFLVLQSTSWLHKTNSNLLIEYYFSKKWFLQSFESLLLYNKPENYLNFVKSSFSFLDSERLNFLRGIQLLPENLINELKLWQFWQQQHNSSWNLIVQYFKNYKGSGLNLFISLIVAFESRFFERKSQEDMQFSGEVLSILVAYIQHLKILDFSITPEIEDIYTIYFKNLNKNTNCRLFEFGIEYIQVKENIIRYALEDGLEMKMIGSSKFSFIESKKFNKQWSKDGELYALNESLYYSYGEFYSTILEREGKIKYVNNRITEENRKSTALRLGIEMAINDLGLLDKDISKESPKLHSIISFLNMLAKSKYERQVKPLFNFKEAIPLFTYKEAVLKRMGETKGKGMEPLLVCKAPILSSITNSSGNSISIIEMEKLIKDFSFTWSTKSFAPFNMRLSFWQKPFVSLGELVLSPINIITAFAGMYAITESILKNYKPNDGKVIEQILKDHLIRPDDVWKVATNWQEVNGNNNGDADVILEDNEYIVLMQLKRTSQKINLRQQLAQIPQDRKAISQLIKANENFIRQGEKRKIKLWYVTTAMEKIGVVENGVIRVSYQEILHLQKNRQVSSLTDFIQLIEKGV